MRYTLTLVPRKEQPSPALQRTLDLRIDLSPFLEVTKARMKRPAGSSAVTAAIDRAADTVTWANIGDALLGVGRKKAVPQKLTFEAARPAQGGEGGVLARAWWWCIVGRCTSTWIGQRTD